MKLIDIIEAKISRKEMKDVALFAGGGTPTDKKKWKISNTKMEEYFGKKGYQAFSDESDMSDFIKTKVKKQAMRYLK